MVIILKELKLYFLQSKLKRIYKELLEIEDSYEDCDYSLLEQTSKTYKKKRDKLNDLYQKYMKLEKEIHKNDKENR